MPVRHTAGSWGPGDIGDLTGATALVTGANSGLGYETALELAAHGAHVVLGCRDRRRARRAADAIEGLAPGSSVDILTVDVSSLESVRRAAGEFAARYDRLDLLVDNAGVMAVPFGLSDDGFEVQFATNHLGPFALTGLLLDLLVTTLGSRVVTVASLAHRFGNLDLSGTEPVQGLTGGHNPWKAYANSKLANLLFAFELDRRLRAAGAPRASIAAHPGLARTGLMANGPGAGARTPGGHLARVLGRVGQSAPAGALPILFAATSPAVAGGDFVGPAGPGGLFGPPVLVKAAARARDQVAAAALWDLSQTLTGVVYALPGGGPGTLTQPVGAGDSPAGTPPLQPAEVTLQ